MEANRDFIKRQLDSGKTIWRFTDTAEISYTKTPNGVFVVRHCNSDNVETISMEVAVRQLSRNFKRIFKVGHGG